jgi:hypothetical protein
MAISIVYVLESPSTFRCKGMLIAFTEMIFAFSVPTIWILPPENSEPAGDVDTVSSGMGMSGDEGKSGFRGGSFKGALGAAG